MSDSPQFLPVGQAPVNRSYSENYDEASGKIAPGFEKYQGLLEGKADSVSKKSGDVAQSFLNQQQDVKDIYGALAKELSFNFERDRGTLVSDKEANIGRQRASAASQGFDTRTGFEADQERSLQNEYNSQIFQLSQQYGIQAEKLAAQRNKSLKELITEAKQALLEGDIASAEILGKAAQLESQKQQLIVSATNAIEQSESQAEALYYDNLYKNAMLDIDYKKLDLQAQQVARSGGGGTSTTDLIEFFNALRGGGAEGGGSLDDFVEDDAGELPTVNATQFFDSRGNQIEGISATPIPEAGSSAARKTPYTINVNQDVFDMIGKGR